MTAVARPDNLLPIGFQDQPTSELRVSDAAPSTAWAGNWDALSSPQPPAFDAAIVSSTWARPAPTDELEERLKRPFIHGWIVGLGVQLLSRLQEHSHVEAVDFMNRVGLRHHPADLEIRREDLAASLGNLTRYVESRRDLWYTFIQARQITERWIEGALAALTF